MVGTLAPLKSVKAAPRLCKFEMKSSSDPKVLLPVAKGGLLPATILSLSVSANRFGKIVFKFYVILHLLVEIFMRLTKIEWHLIHRLHNVIVTSFLY